MYPIEKYTIKSFDKKNTDGTTTKVVMALSTYAGKIVKGIAKCLPTDEYDFENGKLLAAARCDTKVCQKRLTRAQKKMHALANAVEETNRQYAMARAYYDDALKEAFEASKRLREIEEKLG